MVTELSIKVWILIVSKMGENVVKNGFFSCVYEGNKGRFRFCHPDIKNFQLIDCQLIGFFVEVIK